MAQKSCGSGRNDGKNRLESLVGTTAVLRGGDQEQKRKMVAHLIDQYDIRDRPSAEEPAVQQYDEFGDPVGQYPQEGVTAYAAEVGQIVGADPAAVGQFLAANPIARDPTIQAGMVDVAREMHPPGLPAGRSNNVDRLRGRSRTKTQNGRPPNRPIDIRDARRGTGCSAVSPSLARQEGVTAYAAEVGKL